MEPLVRQPAVDLNEPANPALSRGAYEGRGADGSIAMLGRAVLLAEASRKDRIDTYPVRALHVSSQILFLRRPPITVDSMKRVP